MTPRSNSVRIMNVNINNENGSCSDRCNSQHKATEQSTISVIRNAGRIIGFSDHYTKEECCEFRRQLNKEFRSNLASRKAELRSLSPWRRVRMWYSVRDWAWRKAVRTVLGQELDEGSDVAFGKLVRIHVRSRAEELNGLSGVTRIKKRCRIYCWAWTMALIDRGGPVMGSGWRTDLPAEHIESGRR